VDLLRRNVEGREDSWLLDADAGYASRRSGVAVPLRHLLLADSSQTIEEEVTSRNPEHRRALATASGLLRDVSIVFDGEFSYEALLRDLKREKQPFVIRLNTGNGVQRTDKAGNPIALALAPGKAVFAKNVSQERLLQGNHARASGGTLEAGMQGTSLGYHVVGAGEGSRTLREAQEEKRMKIEESFKDL